MLVSFTAVKTNVKFVDGTSIEEIEKSMGEEAGFILEYKGISLGDKSLVIPKYADMDSVEIKKFGGTEFERFQSIVTSLSSFRYVVDQSDPLKVEEFGANCQAISLLLYKTLKGNGFSANLVLDKGVSHMYVRTEVEGQTYNVDLVEKKIEPFSEKG